MEQVELDILPAAADTISDDFGPEAIRDAQADGCTRVRFECGNPDYVVARVLAAKGGIRVHTGQRVQARLADELRAIEEHYRS